MNLAIGRIVHYRVGGTDELPELRPAIVVRLFEGLPYANLQVFVDGSNDSPAHGIGWPAAPRPDPIFTAEERDRGTAWKTSVSEGTGIGMWRWPARS